MYSIILTCCRSAQQWTNTQISRDKIGRKADSQMSLVNNLCKGVCLVVTLFYGSQTLMALWGKVNKKNFKKLNTQILIKGWFTKQSKKTVFWQFSLIQPKSVMIMLPAKYADNENLRLSVWRDVSGVGGTSQPGS